MISCGVVDSAFFMNVNLQYDSRARWLGNHNPWKDDAMATRVYDIGGRRRRVERRLFSYAGYLPERRSGKERRRGKYRRRRPRLGPEYRKDNWSLYI